MNTNHKRAFFISLLGGSKLFATQRVSQWLRGWARNCGSSFSRVIHSCHSCYPFSSLISYYWVDHKIRISNTPLSVWSGLAWFGFGLVYDLAGCDLVWYGMSAVGSLFVSLHPSTLPCVIWFHLGLVCYYLGLYSMVSFSLAWYDMG